MGLKRLYGRQGEMLEKYLCAMSAQPERSVTPLNVPFCSARRGSEVRTRDLALWLYVHFHSQGVDEVVNEVTCGLLTSRLSLSHPRELSGKDVLVIVTL